MVDHEWVRRELDREFKDGLSSAESMAKLKKARNRLSKEDAFEQYICNMPEYRYARTLNRLVVWLIYAVNIAFLAAFGVLESGLWLLILGAAGVFGGLLQLISNPFIREWAVAELRSAGKNRETVRLYRSIRSQFIHIRMKMIWLLMLNPWMPGSQGAGRGRRLRWLYSWLFYSLNIVVFYITGNLVNPMEQFLLLGIWVGAGAVWFIQNPLFSRKSNREAEGRGKSDGDT